MLSVALILCAVVVGVAVVGGGRRRVHGDDVAAGAALGLALFLWLPYLLSRRIGIDAGARTGLALLAIGAAAGVVELAMGRRSARRPLRLAPGWAGTIVIVTTVALAWLLFNASLRVGGDGGLFSAGGGCEDMGMHATLAFAFLRTPDRIVHPTYPIFPGWPLGYPFLADFAAATAMALGCAPGAAFFATAAFALAVLVLNAWRLARRWLPASYAALAILLFFFGGNLGVLYFVRDSSADGLAGTWLNDYVANFNLGLHYGNMATTVLIPMRTSLFGVPLAFATMAIVCRRGGPRAIDRVVAGVLFGALPLVNAHAFLATAAFVGGWIASDLCRRVRLWWPTVAIATLLALPQLAWIHTQTAVSDGGFIRLGDGYLSGTPLPLPTYWLLNGGVFVPLAFAAWWTAPRSMRRALWPLLLLFPLGVAVWLQPNPFDNIKLLLFFHLAGSLLIAHSSRRAFAAGRLRMALAGVAVVGCTASGVLAWVREANIPCEMATAVDRDFAALVLQQTDADSVVLTGSRYTHPVPFLTGRRIVLGFHNWLNQHGIPYADRAKDVAEIYDGAADAPALLARYGVTDVVIGPPEREEFPAIDEALVAARATARFSVGPYTLYRLRRDATAEAVASDR